MQHDLVEMGGYCLEVLRKPGFSVEGTNDITKFENRMLEIGKKRNHAMISPSWHDFTQPEVFGLILKKDGRDVGGVAARHTDIGRESLAEYWQRSYQRLYGEGEVSPVHSAAPIAQHSMRGRIVYLGELYLSRPVRGTPFLTSSVLRYHQALAAITFSPDWLYGFIRAEDINRGKGTQYGFSIQVNSAQLWHRSAPNRSETEYLVANDMDHLNHIAGRIIHNPSVYLPGYSELISTQKDAT